MELDDGDLKYLVVIAVGLFTLGAASGMIYTAAHGFSEVYFLSSDGPKKQIAFHNPVPSFSTVCQIDKRDQVKIADDAYRYSQMTNCRLVNGDIGAQWSNESFPEYNVYQSVKCMQETGNRSKCVPE